MQKFSIKSCIGHKYVYVYEKGYWIVTLKSWYLYFSAWYCGDHVWGWNATESPRHVHSSQPVTRPRSNMSDKTSYRKISWSPEAARFVFEIVPSLWNLTGTWAALLQRRLSNISKWWDNINYQFHGSGTSRDLTLKSLSDSEMGPLVVSILMVGPPPHMKLVRMWNRLEVSRARDPDHADDVGVYLVLMQAIPVLGIKQNKG